MGAVEVGDQASVEWQVSRDRCVERGGQWVLSTPSLLLLVEQAASQALAPRLQPGQHSVGTYVELSHLAPTLEGMQAVALARVTAVAGRRVTFAVEVRDPVEKVAEATHQRFIIDVDRYRTRLEDKRRRWQGEA